MMGNQSMKAWIESTMDCQHTPKNLLRRLDPDLDPRSPTLGIQRTPIYVENLDESSSSFVSSSSQLIDYEDTNICDKTNASLSTARSDPSMMISELNFSDADSASVSDVHVPEIHIHSEDKEMKTAPSTPLTPVAVYTDEKEEISLNNLKPALNSVSLTPVSSNPNDPMVDVRKKLFNSTRMARKPLENVQNTASPQQILRAKQWRDFQEERAKLGIKLDENTPPPKFDGCASAPGKLASRRRPLALAEQPTSLQP